MAVTMKHAIFWDVMLCSSCKNRRFGGTYCLRHQGERRARFLNSAWQLAPSSPHKRQGKTVNFFLHLALCHEDSPGSECLDPNFLELGTPR
jgi:hypothetical protein